MRICPSSKSLNISCFLRHRPIPCPRCVLAQLFSRVTLMQSGGWLINRVLLALQAYIQHASRRIFTCNVNCSVVSGCCTPAARLPSAVWLASVALLLLRAQCNNSHFAYTIADSHTSIHIPSSDKIEITMLGTGLAACITSQTPHSVSPVRPNALY